MANQFIQPFKNEPMVKCYILLFLLLAGFANAEGNLDENRPYREYDGLIFETDLDFDNIYGSIYFGYAFVWEIILALAPIF